MRLRGMLYPWLLVSFACVHLSAQAVVSTRSGVLNYVEGTAFLDDAPVNQKFGTFLTITEGSTLRTEKGRAEVLLTPGVFLRIDENSAIRMISSALTNTRVEFLRGSAILDSNDAASGNPCVLVYKTYDLRFPKPGVYRLGSEPELLEVYTGEAEVETAGEAPKKINESNQFFFGVGMDVKKYGDGTVDTFSEWARNRADTITAETRVGSETTADPDPGDANGAPFILPAPSSAVPGFIQPDYGSSSGTMYLSDSFLGPWGMFTGFPISNIPIVIYVFPRFYGRNRINGTSPRGTGYPVMLPSRTSYPRPNPYGHGLTSMPFRSPYIYTSPSMGHVSVGTSMGHAGVGAFRTAPPRMSPPVAVRPLALPHR